MKNIGHLLDTDSLQFGYKKQHSTSHAIHTLKSKIDYFTSRGSNVFAAFLDCTKGFDRVNHDGIFIKLIQRGVPLCIIDLVKWNGAFSFSFSLEYKRYKQ